ncbi:hypothetical protein AMTR_s00043p00191550 [Amborella trichopoda]|uniref:Uncharacterized protein n=1 Tax=Amborella trichopoda TaxID=13333 RepID=W1PXP5_AMBTC|nr:hypothetical protein AMTR_s00043p00191550 [Amborella trichopoda]
MAEAFPSGTSSCDEVLEDVLKPAPTRATIESPTSASDVIPPFALVEVDSFEGLGDNSEWTLVHVSTPSKDLVEFMMKAFAALSEGQKKVAQEMVKTNY